MWLINRNIYLVKVKVVGHPFGWYNKWDSKQSGYFITKFKVRPSDGIVMITDVECRIISCVKITDDNKFLYALVKHNDVSFLKRSILFDNFTVCKRVKLDKIKRMLK